MRTLRPYLISLALWLLTGVCSVNAEVNPVATSLPVQDWMVRIYVQDVDQGYRYLLCKGALISSQLVLTTGNCYADPYHALEAARKNTPALMVKIGSTGELITVADFKYSPDYAVGLMRLNKPAKSKPIALSKATAAELLNKDVYILSDQKSAGIGNSFYNPGIDPQMDCMVNGSAIYTDKNRTGNAMCYLMGKTETSTTLYRSNAKVIDPESSTAPNTPLDRYDAFDQSGARLYLDFRADNSYPCNEDLGAPIVVNNADGSPELVGVVTAVGMANGLPICSPALVNRFSAVAYYRDYLDKATVQSAFVALCPRVPTLHYFYDDKTVYLYWDGIDGATGYKTHVTTNVGYTKIQTTDIGAKTFKAMTLEADTFYTVAVSAYNANCTSGISKQYTVWD